MKHICITYHMERPNEIAETCISLPMLDEVAADILAHCDDSPYMASAGAVNTILEQLAEIQGYTLLGVCMAREN